MKITRDHVKTVARFIVARSVSGVIVTIAHQNITTETKLQTAELYVGAYVLGSMVADAAKDHTDKKIDDVAELVDKIKAEKAAATLQN